MASGRLRPPEPRHDRCRGTNLSPLAARGRRKIGEIVGHNGVSLASERTVIEGVIVRIRGERAEIPRLDHSPCLPQQAEEAPHRMGRDLQTLQDGAVRVENRCTLEPVKQGRSIDPAQQELSLGGGGDRWLLAERPCATDHHNGVDHQPHTLPARHQGCGLWEPGGAWQSGTRQWRAGSRYH